MKEYIEKSSLYEKIAEMEEMARERYLDTPWDSPARGRYETQMNERTRFKHMVADFPAASVKDILGCDCDPDRLKELVEAEQEGRCFITPCKIGTKIKTKNGEETVNCFIIGQTRSGEIRMFGPGKANITGDFDEDFPDDDMKSADIWYVRIDEE